MGYTYMEQTSIEVAPFPGEQRDGQEAVLVSDPYEVDCDDGSVIVYVDVVWEDIDEDEDEDINDGF